MSTNLSYIVHFCDVCGAGKRESEIVVCSVCGNKACDMHAYDNQTCWVCKNKELGIENH